MTATAKKTPDPEPTAPVAVVHPECVSINKAGTLFCQWAARAPEGATMDDMLNPAAWKRTQEAKRPAIRQDDEVRVVAFDRSWVAWCYVAHATGNGVILSVFAAAQPEGPREHLYEDDLYRVVFTGSGYAVHRKSDDLRIGHPVHSADAARGNLLALYPKQV